MAAPEIVEVLCFNFPDGSTYWAERANVDPGAVVNAWKDRVAPQDRERYSHAQGGFVVVRMPREDYQRIPATNQSHALFEAPKG